MLRHWLDVAITRRGYLMARMRSSRRHPLVASLIEMWIDQYRHIEEDYEDCNQIHPCRAVSESVGACSQTNQPPPMQGAHYSNRNKSDHSDKSDSAHDSDPHL